MVQAFSLTESDLKEMIPSGQQLVYYNRISWAVSYLKKAGLVENVERGVLKITDKGVSEFKNVHKFNANYFRKFSFIQNISSRGADDSKAVYVFI